MRDTMLSEPRC